jgi:hypothetical protein
MHSVHSLIPNQRAYEAWNSPNFNSPTRTVYHKELTYHVALHLESCHCTAGAAIQGSGVCVVNVAGLVWLQPSATQYLLVLNHVQAYEHACEIINCFRWLPMGAEVLLQVQFALYTCRYVYCAGIYL